MCRMIPWSFGEDDMRLATIAVTCAAALIAGQADANQFGPRVIIGGVYHQTSDVTSSDGVSQNGGTCQSAFNCFILFQRVPNHQQVVIEHVSCVFGTAANPVEVKLLSRLSGSFVFEQSALIPIKPTPGSLWHISTDVLHPLHADEIPLVQITGDAQQNYAGHCSIAGHVVTP
jgi:hypothetical protein